VLRELGERLRASLRTGDLPSRYGGEEFALLLPHTTLAAAAMVAARLVGRLRIVAESAPSVTVSIGVAELWGDERPEAFVARADAALYAAKRSGRDRVSLAATPPVERKKPT